MKDKEKRKVKRLKEHGGGGAAHAGVHVQERSINANARSMLEISGDAGEDGGFITSSSPSGQGFYGYPGLHSDTLPSS